MTVPGHSCWPQNSPFDANLAHLLSCNTASLCKNTTHKTPQSAGRFVIQIQRAQDAVELLHQGHPIIEIAHELGYADQSHLTRSLKRLLGYTPGEIVASTFQTG